MEITDMMYELAEQLKNLRDEKKEAEQRVKDINAALDDVEYRLATLMADTETQNFTRAGTMFSLLAAFRFGRANTYRRPNKRLSVFLFADEPA